MCVIYMHIHAGRWLSTWVLNDGGGGRSRVLSFGARDWWRTIKICVSRPTSGGCSTLLRRRRTIYCKGRIYNNTRLPNPRFSSLRVSGTATFLYITFITRHYRTGPAPCSTQPDLRSQRIGLVACNLNLSVKYYIRTSFRTIVKKIVPLRLTAA